MRGGRGVYRSALCWTQSGRRPREGFQRCFFVSEVTVIRWLTQTAIREDVSFTSNSDSNRHISSSKLISSTGKSPVLTLFGRTNTPYPCRQSNYLSPWTVPSFFPIDSLYSILTHAPEVNLVFPTNCIVPRSWKPGSVDST